jgi:hypothetical protein
VVSTSVEGTQALGLLGVDGRPLPWDSSLATDCFDDPSCPKHVTATADGKSLVFDRGDSLVVWDRETDAEVVSVDLGAFIRDLAVYSIDVGAYPIDGTVIVNRWANALDGVTSKPVIVDTRAGTATEADFAGFISNLTAPVSVGTAVGTTTTTSAAGAIERIQFAAGAVSATVAGTASQGVYDRYVFEASAGQSATISITSDGDAANWGVRGPDGQPIKRVENEERSSTFTLTESGDYVVSIGSPTDGTTYALVVEIVG